LYTGFVIWITGLPASGKTTIGKILKEKLINIGFKVEHLDGDEVRRWLSPEAGFSREDRLRHLRRVAYVSHLLARNGVVVIDTFVSPYRESRDLARSLIKRFVEVYIDCPLEEVIKRDPKGLYEKALRGEIDNMTGIQDPYEEPINPEVKINCISDSPEEAANKIIIKLKELGYIGDIIE